MIEKKYITGKVSDFVKNSTIGDVLKHGDVSFFFPFEYSDNENIGDGNGGKMPKDPLTIYMNLYADLDSDERITFKTTIKELLESVYEGYEIMHYDEDTKSIFVNGEFYVDEDGVKVLSTIRDSLIKEANRVDKWIKSAKKLT